jgi:hypothetical protein
MSWLLGGFCDGLKEFDYVFLVFTPQSHFNG